MTNRRLAFSFKLQSADKGIKEIGQKWEGVSIWISLICSLFFCLCRPWNISLIFLLTVMTWYQCHSHSAGSVVYNPLLRLRCCSLYEVTKLCLISDLGVFLQCRQESGWITAQAIYIQCGLWPIQLAKCSVPFLPKSEPQIGKKVALSCVSNQVKADTHKKFTCSTQTQTFCQQSMV